ncbi:PHP domain-containing protein [Anaeromicropila herbilytica]|uniref:Histidinol-phosphatase n=1 Tax=Anaeromicropila herbilytica TaxID=2785025 RepID=A0A7R7EKE0_9FIRM|nr:PHP domain-containing protein [Anaeromicropila herbilytica]BCN30491.1 histidinol-phosphatase [Anaeromicropila herbilytica]
MIDCHIHLENGDYTIEWLNQFVKVAVERGIEEIYLLEHSHRFLEFIPMYQSICEYSEYQRKWFESKNNRNLSLEEYVAFIQQAKQGRYPIKIHFGLEICYFEGYEDFIHEILKHYNFDFLTGSIHWVDGFGFDHKKELWDSVDVDMTYRRYYELMKSLIKSDLFTGVAHPDSIKAFGYKPSYELLNTYEEIASLLCKHDMYAEQSGGLHLNYSESCELGMNKTMLNVFKERGVRILTASDAHSPENVGAYIRELQGML